MGTSESSSLDNPNECSKLSNSEAKDVLNSKDTRWSCWNWCCRLSTGGVLIILGCVNVFLFLQLEAVSYQVGSNTWQISQLQSQLKDQASQTEIVNEKVDEQRNLTIIHMAGTFVLLTCLIAMFHMTAHLRRFDQPDVQRKIVAILWMPPIYGVSSFVSLCLPTTHEYMMILKDFYEAYCIYTFLSFLIAVIGRGSREVVVDILAEHADHLQKPYRCLGCFFHPTPTESDHAMSEAVLLECQILAMQFVFVKPITSITTFVLHLMKDVMNPDTIDDKDPDSSEWKNYLLSARFWILMVQNVSVFFAFAGLLKFYHAVRDELLWCQPFSKFLCIKGVVFMTFWQGLIISITVNLTQKSEIMLGRHGESDVGKDTDAMLQNIIVCLEMLFFSLAHFCVFPTDEWQEGYRQKRIEKPGMGFRDFAKDVGVVLGHTVQGARAKRGMTRQRKNYDEEFNVTETNTLLGEP